MGVVASSQCGGGILPNRVSTIKRLPIDHGLDQLHRVVLRKAPEVLFETIDSTFQVRTLGAGLTPEPKLLKKECPLPGHLSIRIGIA